MENWSKRILTPIQRDSLHEKLNHFEKTTGAELLLVICRSCDPYPAANFRAAFCISYISAFFWATYQPDTPSINLVVYLFGFFILGFLVSKIPFIKKLFLITREMEREVDEKSKELFHTLGIANTKERTASLLLISRMENKVRLIVDSSLKEKMSDQDLLNIQRLIQKQINQRKYFKGLATMIEILEEKYLHFFPEGCPHGTESELKNRLIWEDYSH